MHVITYSNNINAQPPRHGRRSPAPGPDEDVDVQQLAVGEGHMGSALTVLIR